MSESSNPAEELFAYFGSFVNFEQKQKQTIREYRLDRMHQLLEFFGSPHTRLHTIHIAGSKGKGSTAIYLARGLEALGYPTGLYSSPHISNYRERITRAGSFFPTEMYLTVGSRIKQALPEFNRTVLAGAAEPTAFELFTLFAFLLFIEAGCSYAVIETGIGGRLDATNVITPQASVITPIELEHTDILGSTLEQIASEKAGIIKPGVPVFVSPQREKALRVLREKAEQSRSPLFYFPEYPQEFSATVDSLGTRLQLQWEDDSRSPKNKGITLSLAMQGEVQAENAALALSVIREMLPEQFSSPSHSGVLEAVASAGLPGRMEKCRSTPAVILDGAHTPSSIQRTIAAFQQVYGSQGICIFGSVEGKNTIGMAEAITEAFSDIIISQPGTFKPNSPEEVAKVFRTLSPSAELITNPSTALQRALELSGGTRPVLVTGSFYMVAEIRPLLQADHNSGIQEVI
ncbi:MAG: Mur ligase family protein [Spirochaetia bacterium]|nr:Mur ligase family protein [Spirochaetia bacterium]